MRSFLLVLLILPVPCFAFDEAHCTVSAASGFFKPFLGGTFIIEIKTGNSRLVDSRSQQTLATVSDDYVSSLNLVRNSCSEQKEYRNAENGELLGVRYSFDYCKFSHSGNAKNNLYVSVLQSFDLKENRGYYEELVFDNDSDSPFFIFKNCKLF